MPDITKLLCSFSSWKLKNFSITHMHRFQLSFVMVFCACHLNLIAKFSLDFKMNWLWWNNNNIVRDIPNTVSVWHGTFLISGMLWWSTMLVHSLSTTYLVSKALCKNTTLYSEWNDSCLKSNRQHSNSHSWKNVVIYLLWWALGISYCRACLVFDDFMMQQVYSAQWENVNSLIHLE